MALFPVNIYLGWTIRGFQLVFALLTFALAGDALNNYSTSGSLGWAVAVGVLSFLHVAIVLIVSIFYPKYVIAGILIFGEVTFTLFNFTAFIAVAAVFGGNSCSESTVVYDGFNAYYISVDGSACRSAKAAIAFSSFNFALFLLSSFLVVYNAIIPLIKSQGLEVLLKHDEPLFDGPALALISAPVVSKSHGDLEENKTAAELDKGAPKFDEDKVAGSDEVHDLADINITVDDTTIIDSHSASSAVPERI